MHNKSKCPTDENNVHHHLHHICLMVLLFRQVPAGYWQLPVIHQHRWISPPPVGHLLSLDVTLVFIPIYYYSVLSSSSQYYQNQGLHVLSSSPLNPTNYVGCFHDVALHWPSRLLASGAPMLAAQVTTNNYIFHITRLTADIAPHPIPVSIPSRTISQRTSFFK